MLCAMRTRHDLGLGRWRAACRRWRSEVGRVTPVRPARVVDEEGTALLFRQSITHPKKEKRLAEADIVGRHREGQTRRASLVAGDWRRRHNSSLLCFSDVEVSWVVVVEVALLPPVFHSVQA